MIFGEVNSFLSLAERISKFIKNKYKKSTLETVTSRFVRMFECHGLHRNQIPRFLGNNLTIADMQDDNILLPKLSEEILSDACEKLGVRREWIDGVDDQVYQCLDYYKYPDSFQTFITGLIESNLGNDVVGYLISPIEMDWDAAAILILKETIGHVGELPVYRYHLCDNWVFAYWKSRAYLAACVATVRRVGVYVHGIRAPKSYINAISGGKQLLGSDDVGFYKHNFGRWHPEDMFLSPDVYLEGINPERGNFGLRAALSHWLMLDEQGYMETAITGNHRQAFRDALDRLSSK